MIDLIRELTKSPSGNALLVTAGVLLVFCFVWSWAALTTILDAYWVYRERCQKRELAQREMESMRAASAEARKEPSAN